MHTLPAVLEKLPLADLKGLADAAGLEVADRRKGSAVVDALEALEPAHLRVLLNDLPRAALKDACRALELDDSGREKALLVDRLIPLDASVPSTTVTSPLPGTMARRTKQQKPSSGSALGFEATRWCTAESRS